MRAARALFALALGASLGACMKRGEPEPRQQPQPAAYPPQQQYPGTVPAPPPAPPPPPQDAPATVVGKKGEAEQLWVEFERYDRELSLSTGDCATACLALASLERAAKRVCEGAGQLGEGGRCGEATKRLREARGRVRAACTRCSGGTSTDPDAPAP